ncbi:response regulator [Paenibacillus wenxiniae]|uniref:Response regulator n=1 Tax=Paenibacillus wenxiniae TaxID=1636843 RepID=A0ABW4RKT7_9BACL
MYRVVVVDDEPMMLEGWQTMVDWEAYGFELCGMATDGQEGLELAKRLRPELLITDISMPVLDGIGLIKALHQEPDLSMRTIIVSGYSEFDYVRQALQCKVDHYLLKPVLGEEMHELLAELKLVLDQSCAEQERLRQQTEAAAAAAILRLLRAEEATIPEYMIDLLGIKPDVQLRIVVGATTDEEHTKRYVSTTELPHIDDLEKSIINESEHTTSPLSGNMNEKYDPPHQNAVPSSSLRIPRGHRQRSDIGSAIALSTHQPAQQLTDGTAAIANMHYAPIDPVSEQQRWHTDHHWQHEAPMVHLAAACRAAGYMAWTFTDSPGHTGMLLITERLSNAELISVLEACQTTATASSTNQTAYRLYCSQAAAQLEQLPGIYARAMELRRCSSSTHSITMDTDTMSDHEQLTDYRLDEVQECTQHLLKLVQRGDIDGIWTTIEQLPKRWGRQAVPDRMLRVLIRHLLGELLRQTQQREASDAIDSASWLRHLLGTHADDPAGWSLDTLKRLCLRAAEHHMPKPGRAKGTAASIISEAKQYMQEHYREKMQLQELAQRFNLNAVYFGQQFKRELGCSFNDYVHRLRIEEAQKLLRRTDMKVAEIAAWLGYHDSDYFTNKYKALTGELPSVYKSRKQG